VSTSRPPGEGSNGGALELHLPVARTSIERAREAMLAHLGAATLPPSVAFDLELVLEEVLMNIVLHAHADPTGRAVHVTVRRGPDEVELRIEDDGVPFDPTTAPVRPPAATLDEAVPGGLGLPLLRRRARRMEYARVGGRNVLTVAVGLAPRQSAS